MALKTWDQLPLTWPPRGSQAREDIDRIWITAEDTTPGRIPSRLARIGDSRSTGAFGAGRLINGPMNARLASNYGNMPSTGLFTGSAAGRANGGVALGVNASPDGTAGTITSTYVPANLTTRAYLSSHSGFAAIVSDGWYYANAKFNYRGGRFLNRATASLYPEIVGYNTANSSTLNWQFRSVAGPYLSYGAGSQLVTGATAALTGDGTTCTRTLFQSSRQSFPSPSNAINATPYLQLQIVGGHASNSTVFVAAYVNDYANPQGMVVDDFGTGGYKVTQWTSAYPNCGAFFRARPYAGYVVHFGANDCAGGVSAATFKSNLQTLITQIRSWDGQAPIYLVGEYYRGGITGGQLTELDMYPGACYELARENQRCVFINLRRALEMQGWNSTFQVTIPADVAWADATSYSVGNIRYTTMRGGEKEYWRCVVAHTSSAAVDMPGLETDSSNQTWEPVTNLLYYEAGALVHPTVAGGDLMAKELLGLMMAGCGHREQRRISVSR